MTEEKKKELVEVVARAIRDGMKARQDAKVRAASDGFREEARHPKSWDQLDEEGREDFLTDARSAIVAYEKFMHPITEG